jgi:hypothetical protein
MPEVSLYVAVITAAAGVIGAAVPQVTVLMRDSRQAERDRRERVADTRRQACIDLLGAAGDLRTAVANAADYHGAEMTARLAEIRTLAAAVQIHAANVELLAPVPLGDPAAELARAAEKFAVQAGENTNLELEQMVSAPDPSELGAATDAFRAQAVADVRR